MEHEYSELDQMIYDYLIFRNYKSSSHHFNIERQFQKSHENGMDNEQKESVIDRIMTALDMCDSPRLLSLWDAYVIQGLSQKSVAINAETRIAEFYIHLYCATYPFRNESLTAAKTPAVASKHAARAMTIFKHYLETRGKRLLKTPEFQGFRSLHKVGFPPTHPSFSYLFRDDWVVMVKDKVLAFLHYYFNVVEPPALVSLVANATKHSSNASDRESEIRDVFQRRETKLMDFCRSIYGIADDLLSNLEDGKSIDQDFLRSFRERFEEFRTVLEPSDSFDDNAPIRTSRRKGEKKRGKRKHRKEVNPLHLDYPRLVDDLSSMAKDISEELKALDRIDRRLSSVDAEICHQSALQGAAVFESLEDMLQSAGQSATNAAHAAIAQLYIDSDLLELSTLGTSDDNSTNMPMGYAITLVTAFVGGLSKLPSAARKDSTIELKKALANGMDEDITPHSVLFSSSVTFIFNMLRFIVTLTCSNKSCVEMFLEKNKIGLQAFFSIVLDLLVALQEVVEETSASLHSVVTLSLILLLLMGEGRHNKLSFIKRGGVEWIAATLGKISLISHDTRSTGESRRLLLSIALLCDMMSTSESRRALVSATKLQHTTTSLLKLLLNVMISNDNSLATDLSKRALLNLLLEPTVQQTVNELPETASLRDRMTSLEEQDKKLYGEYCDQISQVLTAVSLSENASGASTRRSDDILTAPIFAKFLSSIVNDLPRDALTTEYIKLNPREFGPKLLLKYMKQAEHEEVDLDESLDSSDASALH